MALLITTTTTSDSPAPAEAPASRALPTDLLIVQRDAMAYKATAEQLKGYMLSPATAAEIGAIKPGTNLSVALPA